MSELELTPTDSDSKNSKGSVPDDRVFDVILAPFWKRVVAWAIDVILLSMIVVVALYFSSANIPTSLEGITQEHLTQMSQIMVLINVAYFTTLEGLTGQTFGKKLLGIVVYEEKGKRVGLSTALLRRIGLVIPLFNFIDGLTILFTSKNQRIFDIIASTFVFNADYENEAAGFLKGENISERLEEKTGRMKVRNLGDSGKENMVKKLKDKKSELEEKFEEGEIDEERYREIKGKYESRIKTLEKKLEKSKKKYN